MGNASTKSASRSPAPQHFTRLPLELQQQIWKYAVDQWMDEYFDAATAWTVHGKRIFMIYGDPASIWNKDANGVRNFRAGYVIQLPSLFFVCTTSRNITYDAFVGYIAQGKKEPVPRGDDIHLFFRDGCGQPTNLNCAQINGWRVQDFRFTGLQKRIGEERERLVEMEDELAQLRAWEVVDETRRSEGYVRLSLVGSGGTSKMVPDEERPGRNRTVELYPRSQGNGDWRIYRT